MKVRNNATYIYYPCGFDMIRPCQGNTLKKGDIVKVITLPSAPPPNTMGQCYVGDKKTGKFICMVHTSSLYKKNDPDVLAVLRKESAK